MLDRCGGTHQRFGHGADETVQRGKREHLNRVTHCHHRRSGGPHSDATRGILDEK